METKSKKIFESTIVFINTILSVIGGDIFSHDWPSGTRRKMLHFLSILLALSMPITSVSNCAQSVFKFFMLQMFYIDLRAVVDRCRKFRIKFAEDIEIERSMSTDTLLIRKPKFVIKISYLMTIVTVIVTTVTPLLKEERTFSFFYYLPFYSPFESPCYELNYTYVTVILLWFIEHVVLGLDSIFILLISEMCLQFNVIKFKLSKFGKLDESEYEIQVKMLREIQEMVQELSESIKKIDAIFSIVLLVTFLTTFLALTALLFSVATVGRATDIGLLFCAILQLLFYCLCGELLKHKMESLTFLLYDTPWYNLKIKEQKSLVTMMTYTQIVPTLKAGGYTELSLALYMQILKTAYTYYAVMKDNQK